MALAVDEREPINAGHIRLTFGIGVALNQQGCQELPESLIEPPGARYLWSRCLTGAR